MTASHAVGNRVGCGRCGKCRAAWASGCPTRSCRRGGSGVAARGHRRIARDRDASARVIGGDFRDVAGAACFGMTSISSVWVRTSVEKLAERGFVEFGLVEIGKRGGVAHEASGFGRAGDHALAGFAGDEENGVFRGGADVVADLAAGAEIRIHAGFSLLDGDGSIRRAALGTDGAERSLLGEAEAVEDERERRMSRR